MAISRDISKLPTWAQSKLVTLERDVQYWKNKATAADTPADLFTTRIMGDIVNRFCGTPIVNLSGLSAITFRVKDTQDPSGLLTASIIPEPNGYGPLSIRCEDGFLGIRPVAANQVTLVPLDYKGH